MKKQDKYKHYYSGNPTGGRSGLCGDMSFTAAEAYKMLRTKINLIIPNEIEKDETEGAHQCRIIGVTSALAGEGKTTTSINMAYSMAETGKHVCLLEADMRLPNIGKRLSLEEKPGLSNLLTGQCSTQTCLQRYVGKNETKLYVITAGDIPPMPSELLGSNNMKKLLEGLSKTFDAIIIDLPPISVVTDALSVAPQLTGMVVVVRENYCDKRVLRDVVSQFQQTETKILGIVFNGANQMPGTTTRYKPYYKGYNKHYYNKRHSSYGEHTPHNQPMNEIGELID